MIEGYKKELFQELESTAAKSVITESAPSTKLTQILLEMADGTESIHRLRVALLRDESDQSRSTASLSSPATRVDEERAQALAESSSIRATVILVWDDATASTRYEVEIYPEAPTKLNSPSDASSRSTS